MLLYFFVYLFKGTVMSFHQKNQKKKRKKVFVTFFASREKLIEPSNIKTLDATHFIPL